MYEVETELLLVGCISRTETPACTTVNWFRFMLKILPSVHLVLIPCILSGRNSCLEGEPPSYVQLRGVMALNR
jgi:hypothetical protein